MIHCSLKSQTINCESFEFNAMAVNETKVNMIELFSFFEFKLQCSLHQFFKTYCVWCLLMDDFRLQACNVQKLFWWNEKNLIHDLGSRYNGKRNRSDMTLLNSLKKCCHHILRDLCIQGEGAWYKLIKYYISEVIGVGILKLLNLNRQ